MEKKNVKQNVLERIEHDAIQPKSRWHFLLRNNVVWILGGASVIVGGIAVAVAFYSLGNNDWALYAEASGSNTVFLIESLPYFWILLLLGFIGVAHYNIKHTKHGYRYRLPVIILASLSGSALFGIALHAAGVGRAIDVVLEENVPAYSQYLAPKHKPWDHPEHGVLSGRVTEVRTQQQFVILDRRGNTWVILADNAEVRPPMIQVEQEHIVRLIGEVKEADMFTFTADVIGIKPTGLPFGPRKHHKNIRERFFEELRITE